MNYKSLAEIKDISRDKMLGRYGTAIGAFLFIRLFVFTATNVSALSAPMYSNIYMLMMFVFALIEGIFVFGEQQIYMEIATGRQASSFDLFRAFKTRADSAIGWRLIFLTVIAGSFFISSEATVLLKGVGANSIFIEVGSMILAGLVCLIFYLNYALVIMIMHDFPELKVMQAFKKSRDLMRGRKKELLRILASFIPLWLVVLISFGIGAFFVHPYFKLTLTEFYLDGIRAGRAVNGEHETDEERSKIDIRI
ncbi:MAG: DUF975 family protein [Lachnospiraceae bacterium]|nr:DUF975 family protein [Lachnospiraceae bacterium]